MAFERGEVLELLRTIMVDGEMMRAGSLVEVSPRDARDLIATRRAVAHVAGAKTAPKAKAA